MNSNDQVDPYGRVESQGNSCPSLLEVKQLRSGMVFSTKRQHLLQLIILLLSLPVICLYAFLDPLSVFFFLVLKFVRLTCFVCATDVG